jgi:hypothetical protein
MKKSTFLLFGILIIIGIGLFYSLSPVTGNAASAPRSGCPTGLVPCGGKDCPCTLCDFFVMFKNIVYSFVFLIVPLVAVLMILIGGFMYIIAFINPSEGGSETLNRAKSVFKSVVVGLFIVFGAWLIVNLFFQVIGVEKWTNLRGGWQIIDCESSMSAPSGSSSTSGGSSGGTSGPSLSSPIIITERNVLGSGFVVQEDFLNTSTETRQYAAFLYDANGELVTSDPHTEDWISVPPGQTRTFYLSPNVYGSNLEKLQQAGSNYKIETKWRPTAQSPQGGSVERTRDLPRTLVGLPN